MYSEGDSFAAELRQKHVLVNVTDHTVLRIVPPLIFSRQHVDEFINAFTETLAARKEIHPSLAAGTSGS
jgi:acetylornithine/succinyldiaminopimelate/putrescine aminotransferase